MAITQEGIIFTRSRKRGFGFSFFVFLELLLSLILVVSLSANLIFPQQSLAGTGISQKLSYQGRLTDLSGNTLGGSSGTNYCFRFSIYDAPTGGSQKWPSGTPTSETVKVKDGAFATAIGNSASLSFDFTTLKSSYLNVEVNRTPTTCGGTWEQLDVRQRIDAVAYARAAELVYGDLLRVASGSGVFQIGTGSGTGTPVYLGLDQRNVADSVDGSCTNNGQIWYTAAGKNRFRVCQGSTIQDMVGGLLVQDSDVNIGRASVALDFNGAGVSVINNGNGIISVNVPFAGIAANGSTVSSGSIVFSNLNGVSFGFNGSTLTASVNAGGGGGATVSHWPPFPVGLATNSNYTGATAAGTNITASFHVAPLQLEQAVAFSRMNINASFGTIAGTGSVSIAYMLGIYTLNAGTALSLLSSYMFRDEISQNSVTAQSHRFYWGTNSTSNSSSSGGNISANYAGLRNLPLFVSAGASLSAGQYYIAFGQTNKSSASNIMPAASIMYISESQSSLGGQIGSAATLPPFPLMGQFSSTTAVGNFTSPFMPSSINTTAITNTGGSSQWKWPYVNFLGK